MIWSREVNLPPKWKEFELLKKTDREEERVKENTGEYFSLSLHSEMDL